MGRRGWFGSAFGSTDAPSERWDEELAPQRDARHAQARRRILLAMVVVLLVVLVATMTVVLGGDRGRPAAKVSTQETTSSIGGGAAFGPSLPTPGTAVSLGGQVVIPDPATTLPPLLTIPGTPGTAADGLPVATQPGATQPGVTQPGTTQPGTTVPVTTRPPSTTQPVTTTTQPTTTTPPPQPFAYTQPHNANGTFSNGQGVAPCHVPPEDKFVLATPQPGTLTITVQSTGDTASGDVDPNGNFVVSNKATGERYTGQTSHTGATASYSASGCGATDSVTFTFVS
ncbi:MAG: hypothetical protein QOJ67_1534 [Acidimicrobiaceae bacterium]|jgi:hypothetical protein